MIKTLHFKTSLYLFLLVFITSCAAYKDVELIGVNNYALGDLAKETVDLTVKMEVNNPNGYNIRIKKTTLDLFLEGKEVGKAKMQGDIVLKKKTQQEYEFTIRANYKELSGAILKSIGSLFGKNEITLGLKGKVKAKAFGIVGKKFDLDVKEKVNLNDLMKMSGMQK